MFKDMTREEEIIKQGIFYTSQICPACISGDDPFNEDVRDLNRNKAFEAGAKWADEHPINDMWHTPDEEPQGKNWCIMARDGQGLLWTTTRAEAGIITSSGWHQYVWKHNLIEWSYYKYPAVTVK